MPVGKMCGPAGPSNTPVAADTRKTKTTTQTGRKDSNASTQAVETDQPSPCKLCNQVVDEGKAIRCDKCSTWLHFRCSELSKAHYDWLTKSTCPTSVKWFCPACQSEPEKNSVDSRFDTLSALILTVTQQNAEILKSMKNDQANLTEVLDDQKEKEERRKNSVFFNIPESADTEQGKIDDTGKVKDVIKHICPDIADENLDTLAVTRLGTRRTPSDDHPTLNPDL